MRLRYKGTAVTLTKGGEYDGKIDSKGTLRVKNDKGNWSKYAVSDFDVISITPEDVGVMKDALSTVSGIPAEDFIKTFEPEPTKRVLHAVKFGGKEPSAESIAEEFEKSKEAVKEKIKATEAPMKKKITLRSYLEGQGVPNDLINALSDFRKTNGISDEVKDRIPQPKTLYQGGKVWIQAISAILEGKHILLEGAKATGKNVLADNLSFAFGRPQWDISFHTHMDASSLIGAETFKDNKVQFRPGSIYNCALHGGFGVLDEINMAKPEASAVLHAVLDDRRVIDVPGYDRIKLHESTRFIGTMNYGYAGTRELNEALTSRFVVINVPSLNRAELTKLLASKYPTASISALEIYAGLFEDLQRKAENAEISTKCVDLRGILSAIGMTSRGIVPADAIECNITNKAFEKYERDIVRDLAKTRIPKSWDYTVVFPPSGTVTVKF